MRVELLYKIRCQVLENACGARELTLEMAAAVAAASAWLQSAEGGDLGLESGVAGGLKLRLLRVAPESSTDRGATTLNFIFLHDVPFA